MSTLARIKVAVGLTIALLVLSVAPGAEARLKCSASSKCSSPNTLAMARAAIDAACPCAAQGSAKSYKKCTKKAIKAFTKDAKRLDLPFTKACKKDVTAAVKNATCGRTGFVLCNTTNKKGTRTTCKVTKASKCQNVLNRSSLCEGFVTCADSCNPQGGCAPLPTPPTTTTIATATTTTITAAASTTSSTTTTTTLPVPVPQLVGLDLNKPLILPATVQAAYNDDTMFFHISWEGDRGDTHDYVHYTNGAWQNEGAPRREAQSTIDNDPARGPTNRTSTIYESRVTFMIDDPTGANAVPDFDKYGCFLTCHDDSRAMPTWDPSTNLTKYLNDDTPGSLDLWHHRLARANPIGGSDDQNVTRIPMGGEVGGRFGDAGDSPWQVNNIVSGVPTYAFDPLTTGGVFAFQFEDLFQSPLRFYRRADAPEQGAGPVAVGQLYGDAVAMGYVPQEGDTIPRRRLRQPTGSRGDITARGTTFTPSAGNPLFGRIDSNTQRLLDTGHADDTTLVDGGVYNIAFAIHTGMVTVRDHYVGFTMTLSLGGEAADIEAVKIDGTGTGALPDFSDGDTFPVVHMNLFLPGITSLEFLKGQNNGLTYIDPRTDEAIDQEHAGDNFLPPNGSLGCRDCHTASSAEAFNPPSAGGFNARSMEALAPQRGGISTPTPIPPAP
jgi:hypothetical protein